ncbi:MAG: hypothetical protein KDK62_05525 [Chlamydiia bacterium]|nr:hypothetical protein [Chlamydiia bacterium]
MNPVTHHGASQNAIQVAQHRSRLMAIGMSPHAITLKSFQALDILWKSSEGSGSQSQQNGQHVDHYQ